MHSVLRLSGIVKVTDGCLMVRNRIYTHVFNKQWAHDNMPDEELRRQQRAYWQGVLRTAALAGVVLLIVSALAYRAMLLEKHARIETAKSRQAEAFCLK